MAIDGTTIKEAEFYDDDSGKRVKINLTVRDIILFRLLEKLTGALRRHG